MNNVAEEIVTIIKSTHAFVIEQAPDVAKQMLLQSSFDSWLAIAIASVVLIVAVVGVWAIIANDCWDAVFLAVLAAVLFILPPSIVITNSISTLYKINNAPKLFLLEEFSHITRSCK